MDWESALNPALTLIILILLGTSGFLFSTMVNKGIKASEVLTAEVRALTIQIERMQSILDIVVKDMQQDIIDIKADLKILHARTHDIGNELMIDRLSLQTIGVKTGKKDIKWLRPIIDTSDVS